MTSLILSSLVLLLFPMMAQASEEWNCHQGKVTYRELNVLKSESSSYCIQKDTYHLMAKSCMTGKCAALKALDRATGEELDKRSDVGTPASAFCHALGGRSRLIEIPDSSIRGKINQCLFTADGSFTDADYLVRRMKLKHPAF